MEHRCYICRPAMSLRPSEKSAMQHFEYHELITTCDMHPPVHWIHSQQTLFYFDNDPRNQGKGHHSSLWVWKNSVQHREMFL